MVTEKSTQNLCIRIMYLFRNWIACVSTVSVYCIEEDA